MHASGKGASMWEKNESASESQDRLEKKDEDEEKKDKRQEAEMGEALGGRIVSLSVWLEEFYSTV